jgi:hypothetical protein
MFRLRELSWRFLRTIKYFVLAAATMAILYAINTGPARVAYAGDSINGDHFEYVDISSAGVAQNIIWTRHVKEIEIVNMSTQTLYVNWVSSVAAYQLAYTTWSYVMDYATRTIHVEAVESDMMSVYTASAPRNAVGNRMIRVQGKGW